MNDQENGVGTAVGAPVAGQTAEPVGFQTISPEAYAWYNNPLSLGGIRPRGILPLALAFDVSQAIGRSLTQADLQFLVQKDGEPVLCSGCGKEFQPVKWAVVNESLIMALRSGLEFGKLNGEVRWAGSHIVKVDDGGVPGILSFCGAFFFYDPRRRVEETGAEFFSINRQSCLGIAYRCDENRDEKGKFRPLRSLASALELIETMQANHEARVAEIRQKREERSRQTTGGVQNAFRQLGSKSFGIHGGAKQKGSRR